MTIYCYIDVHGYRGKLCILLGACVDDKLYDYKVYVIDDKITVRVKSNEIKLT